MITEAIQIATIAHVGQKRKNTGLDYIVHPMEVMSILMRYGVTDEVTLSAALLHDVIEDCDARFANDIRLMNVDVFNKVSALTKEKGLTDRKLSNASYETQLVKVADINSNTRDSRDLHYLKKKLEQLQILGKVQDTYLYCDTYNQIHNRILI